MITVRSQNTRLIYKSIASLHGNNGMVKFEIKIKYHFHEYLKKKYSCMNLTKDLPEEKQNFYERI